MATLARLLRETYRATGDLAELTDRENKKFRYTY